MLPASLSAQVLILIIYIIINNNHIIIIIITIIHMFTTLQLKVLGLNGRGKLNLPFLVDGHPQFATKMIETPGIETKSYK